MHASATARTSASTAPVRGTPSESSASASGEAPVTAAVSAACDSAAPALFAAWRTAADMSATEARRPECTSPLLLPNDALAPPRRWPGAAAAAETLASALWPEAGAETDARPPATAPPLSLEALRAEVGGLLLLMCVCGRENGGAESGRASSLEHKLLQLPICNGQGQSSSAFHCGIVVNATRSRNLSCSTRYEGARYTCRRNDSDPTCQKSEKSGGTRISKVFAT
jgi:hypothetical protein